METQKKWASFRGIGEEWDGWRDVWGGCDEKKEKSKRSVQGESVSLDWRATGGRLVPNAPFWVQGTWQTCLKVQVLKD